MAGALVRFPSSARPPPARPRMGRAAIDAVGGGRTRLLSVLLLGATQHCQGTWAQRSGPKSFSGHSCLHWRSQPNLACKQFPRIPASTTSPAPRTYVGPLTHCPPTFTRPRPRGKCFNPSVGPKAYRGCSAFPRDEVRTVLSKMRMTDAGGGAVGRKARVLASSRGCMVLRTMHFTPEWHVKPKSNRSQSEANVVKRSSKL